MLGLGLLLIALSPAFRAPELHPPARVSAETATPLAREGRRRIPAVFPRRVTRTATSVAGDRFAVTGPLAAPLAPRRRPGAARLPDAPGLLARGADARPQRGPPPPSL